MTLAATGALALALVAIFGQIATAKDVVIPAVNGQVQNDLIGPSRLAMQKAIRIAIGLMIIALIASAEPSVLITKFQSRACSWTPARRQAARTT